tara:strand:+ start:64 stop:936 length:873 start_codon:yes stop_codon:yes gene_type:complete
MGKSTNYIAKVPDDNGFIGYSDAENEVWRDLYAQQIPNINKHAANAYLEGLDLLSMAQSRIPQCNEISEHLRPLTGWTVAPVPALIGFQRFFTMLAEQTFPAASFIRSRADFDYIEEPDIFHEIFGHTPLLTDPGFAHFSQRIGQIGCEVGPADYSWLIRLYWFTIEFGLIRQNGEYKALGSGLTSSPTELVYSVRGAPGSCFSSGSSSSSSSGSGPDTECIGAIPERREFNVIDILRTPYRIDIHQPIYYVINNIDDLFQAADRDLHTDIKQAQSLGLFEPSYPCKLTG